MPPSKKKRAKNGFMHFTFEWKEKYGKHMSLQEATMAAGKIWSGMSAEARGPYNEKAKESKVESKMSGDKFTCTGRSFSHVESEKISAENRERDMKTIIENTVRNSVKKGELATQSYYFIMVNYFAKTSLDGVHVPAEIAVAEYSLQHGVSRKYHSFVNPHVNIYGQLFLAQQHADLTHKLPLPPKAMGESDLGRLYDDILKFIRNEETGEYPPIYTRNDSINIVESSLEFLKADNTSSDVTLNVYSIQYLFYILKEATCQMGDVEKPASAYITDVEFERDYFEYQPDIACAYHDEVDRTKYCTLSLVTRWGFTFSEYCCLDIAISLIPGRHVPINTNLNAVINPAQSSTIRDNESMASFSTEASKPLSEHKIYNEADNLSQIENIKPSQFVPSPSKRAKPINSIDESYMDNEDRYENPWAARSRNVPPQPDTSSFNVDYTYRNDDISDDLVSLGSCGRGRGYSNALKKFKKGFGRGDSFLP